VTETQPADLQDLPPSAKLVYKVLEYADGPMTQAELVEETRLPARTVRYGLDKLEAGGVTVHHQPNIDDPRRTEYWLPDA